MQTEAQILSFAYMQKTESNRFITSQYLVTNSLFIVF